MGWIWSAHSSIFPFLLHDAFPAEPIGQAMRLDCFKSQSHQKNILFWNWTRSVSIIILLLFDFNTNICKTSLGFIFDLWRSDGKKMHELKDIIRTKLKASLCCCNHPIDILIKGCVGTYYMDVVYFDSMKILNHISKETYTAEKKHISWPRHRQLGFLQGKERSWHQGEDQHLSEDQAVLRQLWTQTQRRVCRHTWGVGSSTSK